MDNFSFKSWTSYKQETQPSEGFNVSSDYTSPSNETEVRNQLQSLHSQIKKFINETIVAGINSILSRLGIAEEKVTGLEANEITSITGDDTIGVTKIGKTYQVSLITSPTGVTKTYVDTQDATMLSSAKDYSDANLVTAKSYTDSKTQVITGTLTAGNTTKTFEDARITTQNLIISTFSPSIEISETADPILDTSNHTITLSFEAQQSDITVGYRIEGTY